MKYKSYTELAKIFNPELDYDIITQEEFRHECKTYIMDYYNDGDMELHVWAMIIGGDLGLDMEYDISHTTDYKDLEILINIIDLGYNGTLFKTDEWCHEFELSSKFDYSILDKYPQLYNIVFDAPYFSLSENLDIKSINDFHVDTFIRVFIESISLLTIQHDILMLIYKKRNELSLNLKNELYEVYSNTTNPNIKIILALILNKKDKIDLSDYKKGNPFRTDFIFINGTFNIMKEILSIEDLKEYYYSFLNRSIRIYDIENLEMLQLLISNRTNSNIGECFMDFFRNLKYLGNFDILDNIILKDQQTIIKIFDHMATSQRLGADYMRKNACDFVLSQRPLWDDFKLRFQPEPDDLV